MRPLLFLLLCLMSLNLVAKTHVDLYTWRVQEKTLWEKINQRNLIPGLNVNVKVVDYGTYKNHLLLALQNNRPHLFQWAPGAAALGPLIEHGFIQPTTVDLTMMNPSALPSATSADGQYYGVPFALQAEGLLVNKKKAQQLGIHRRPTSLDELETVFSKVKKQQVTPLQMANDNWYVPQVVVEVLSAGLIPAEFARRLEAGKACFTDEPYLLMLRTLQNWYTAGYINSDVLSEDYQGMATSKALGNALSILDGSWRMSPNSPFYDVDPNYEFEFWPIPGRSGKFYALGDGTYQVNALSPLAKEANRVLKFTTSKEFATLFANTINEIPAYGGKIQIQNARLRELSNNLSTQGYGVSLFVSAQLNKRNPSYQTLSRDAIRMIFNGKTVEQAAEHIQTGLNQWQYIGTEQCSL